MSTEEEPHKKRPHDPYHEMTLAEVAEESGIPLTSVRRLEQTALAKIREMTDVMDKLRTYL